jgi:hypothetical protein
MRSISILRVGALALALAVPALSGAYAGGDVDETTHSDPSLGAYSSGAQLSQSRETATPRTQTAQSDWQKEHPVCDHRGGCSVQPQG